MVPLIGSPTPDPRVAAQLLPDKIGGSTPATGPYDCSVCCTQGQIIFHSHGGLVPTRAQIRTIAGAGPTSGLTSGQIKKVLNYYGVPFTDCPDFPTFESKLASEANAVSVAIDNGWLNANDSDLSGDLGYDGGHRICLRGMEQLKLNGAWWTQESDPVHDGRVRTINGAPHQYPKSVLTIRLAVIEQAMSAFGQFSAISVARG